MRRSYNKADLSYLAPRIAAEGMSNRAVARFLSAYNSPHGLPVITESKVRGAMKRSREEVLEDLKQLALQALFFDSRKDKGMENFRTTFFVYNFTILIDSICAQRKLEH